MGFYSAYTLLTTLILHLRLSPLSSAKVSLCCREAREKEKESVRGCALWEGEREERGSRLFPLPVIRGSLFICRLLLFYWDTQQEPFRRREDSAGVGVVLNSPIWTVL